MNCNIEKAICTFYGQIYRFFSWLKGVFSKPSGKRMVAPFFFSLSQNVCLFVLTRVGGFGGPLGPPNPLFHNSSVVSEEILKQ